MTKDPYSMKRDPNASNLRDIHSRMTWKRSWEGMSLRETLPQVIPVTWETVILEWETVEKSFSSERHSRSHSRVRDTREGLERQSLNSEEVILEWETVSQVRRSHSRLSFERQSLKLEEVILEWETPENNLREELRGNVADRDIALRHSSTLRWLQEVILDFHLREVRRSHSRLSFARKLEEFILHFHFRDIACARQ